LPDDLGQASTPRFAVDPWVIAPESHGGFSAEATEPEDEETRNQTAGKGMEARKIKAKIFIVIVAYGYIL
jgi:hypothetical protein